MADAEANGAPAAASSLAELEQEHQAEIEQLKSHAREKFKKQQEKAAAEVAALKSELEALRFEKSLRGNGAGEDDSAKLRAEVKAAKARGPNSKKENNAQTLLIHCLPSHK